MAGDISNITGRRKTGRCANGAERDAGSIGHAVAIEAKISTSWAPALCGAKPGRLSAGWSDQLFAISCPRCIRKLTRILVDGAAS